MTYPGEAPANRWSTFISEHIPEHKDNIFPVSTEYRIKIPPGIGVIRISYNDYNDQRGSTKSLVLN